jgi:hypothetical protein
LRKSFEWFYKQVRDTYGALRNGTALAKFIDELSDRLFFTVITVTDELNAFKVFETLNASGVRLSPTDLLKNYLFSVVHRERSHPSEMETLERRWEAMVGRLGGESFPDFLRVHWNSRRRFVREADLFKTIRSETPHKDSVFELLRQMEQDIDLYAALPYPEAELWEASQRQHVRELRMFSVRQPWPLLLASFRAFDRNSFTEILRACSIVSFRYNVIGGLATNEQERVYNGIQWHSPENCLRRRGARSRCDTSTSAGLPIGRPIQAGVRRENLADHGRSKQECSSLYSLSIGKAFIGIRIRRGQRAILARTYPACESWSELAAVHGRGA